MSAYISFLRWFGGTRLGLWWVRKVSTPTDRRMYLRTGNSSVPHEIGPVLLLTSTGHRTGKLRTTPVIYLRDGEHLVVCTVNPGFAPVSAWARNLQANPLAEVRIGRDSGSYRAHAAAPEEMAKYWPELIAAYPAYEKFYARSRERFVFVLEATSANQSPGRQ